MQKRGMAAILLTLVLLAALLPRALAAGRVDLNRELQLHLSYQKDGAALAGAQVSIYRVAEMEETGALTAAKEFGAFSVDIRGKNDEKWRELAATMEAAVLRDKMQPFAFGRTDVDGKLLFPQKGGSKLMPGLYLVRTDRLQQGGYWYDSAPFFVMLPEQEKKSNEWVYDVTANAKPEKTEIPSQPETAVRKALKVWQDAGHETLRPKSITVQLIRGDGVVWDTVTLSEQNNWRYTWEGLDASYRWTAAEVTPEGYRGTVVQEGITFVLTNTYSGTQPPETPDKPSEPGRLPQTGQFWWPALALAAAGLACVAVGLLRRRGS